MVEPPIELLKAIAHPLRYQILAALAAAERNVGEIEDATGISQPTLSQQLAVLRGAGLVDTRREARQIFYRTAASRVGAAMGALAGLLPEPETEIGAEPSSRSTGAAVFARMA